MYRRSDPRWNRTIQHISENLEHANETAAENIYGFSQRYVSPCLASLTNCCNAVTAPCFPSSTDRRRHRARSRGRAELSFDFYDDWDNDESDGLLAWGSDNLDRFLASPSHYGTTTSQPPRPQNMSYASTRARDPRFDPPRRKTTAHPHHSAQDPTLIPSSSYFGFLGRLPFNLGGKALRYKPSAADLTDHPAALRRPDQQESHPLIEEDSDEDFLTTASPANPAESHFKSHRRARSNTHTSGHTTSSLSSRGDIFPSEDELDDAVPLDDEFTIALERRTTATLGDDSRNTSARPSRRTSSRTVSSGRASDVEVPSLAELEGEEECVRREEESEVLRRRELATTLALRRGLVVHVGDGGGKEGFEEEGGGEGQEEREHGDEGAEERPVTAVRRLHDELSGQLGQGGGGQGGGEGEEEEEEVEEEVKGDAEDEFVPARLPRFG